jgi:N-acetylglucosamine repressor
LLRRINERRVLEMLIHYGPLSRADLTRLTGISAPTISKAVVSLTEAELLEAREAHGNKTGRPARLYSLAAQTVQMLGLVIEPTRATLVAGGIDCRIHPHRQITFDLPDSYDRLLDLLAEHAATLLGQSAARALGLGVSVPTMLNPQIAPVLRVELIGLLDGKPFADDLRRRLHLHTVVMKQAHALCLAQRLAFLDDAPLDDFVLVDATAPMALGIVLAGQLFTGAHGRAGVLPDMAGPADLPTVIACAINRYDPRAVFVYADPPLGDPLPQELLDQVAARALPESLAGCRIAPATADLNQAPLAAYLDHLIDSLAPLQRRK